MRMTTGIVWIACLTAAAAHAEALINPYTGRMEREAVFGFAEKPSVSKQRGGFLISFAAKAASDATVSVVDKDGKVVRHLASGVLGKNAPWPFKQNSLSQEIEWDGKDDRGQPVPDGSRIMVGLGLEARLDGILGSSPGRVPDVQGVAVGPRGNLFVLSGVYATRGQPAPFIRVYDREGRYLRQICPPPSSVPPEKAGLFSWNRTAWGSAAPVRVRPFGGRFVIALDSPYPPSRQTPVVTEDGRFLWTAVVGSDKELRRVLYRVDGRDGTVTEKDIVTLDPGCANMGGGMLHMALSPDNRWLYCGSSEPVKRHGVFRMDMQQPGPATLFLGTPDAPGTSGTQFNKPTGVACDGQGNLYVADTGNDRIQVFRPDGGHLRSLPIEGPLLVSVDRKSRAIYVLQVLSAKGGNIVKLAGLDDPAVQASIPVRAGELTQNPLLAADYHGEKATLWVKLGFGGLKRFEDAGTSFKELPMGDVTKSIPGWGGWMPWTPSASLAADARREELYVREWGCCWPSQAMRVNGRTGEVVEQVFPEAPYCNGIESMAVSPYNGDLYMSFFKSGSFLSRYDPDARRLVPLHESRPYANGAKPMLFSKEQPVIGIPLATHGGARGFMDPMTVAPNGDLYIPLGIAESALPLLKAAGLDVPPTGIGVEQGNLLAVFDPNGKLKCLSALPGLIGINGIGVGRRGAVYLTIRGRPVNVGLPEGLEPKSRYDGNAWGTVIKFNSRFDQFPVGRIEGRWAGQAEGTPWHKWKPLDGKPTHVSQMFTWADVPMRIENMHWDYPGASPVAVGGCTCHRSKIAVDGFERLFVPAAQTCTVNVLDANGNVVVRIGGYGNMDNRGAHSPVVDPQTGELRPRRPDDPPDLKSPLQSPDVAFIDPTHVEATDEAVYVHDRCNERIVRAALEYSTQEILALP
jgi:hypothetical protein